MCSKCVPHINDYVLCVGNNNHQPSVKNDLVTCIMCYLPRSHIYNLNIEINWIGKWKMYEIPIAGFSHSVNRAVNFFYFDDIRIFFDNNSHSVSFMSSRKTVVLELCTFEQSGLICSTIQNFGNMFEMLNERIFRKKSMKSIY